MPPTSRTSPVQHLVGTARFAVFAIGVATLTAVLQPSPARAQTPVDITALGTPVALVTAPTGGGNKNIEIIRDGKHMTVSATVGKATGQAAGKSASPRLNGAVFRDLEPGMPGYGQVQGVLVAEVVAGSPA